MKDAEACQGADGLYVNLYKDEQLFGTVDIRKHSLHYANDVVQNWITGILKEDNPHIERSR